MANDCSCSEPTIPDQVALPRRRDSVTEIFAECGKRLGYQARQVVLQTKKRSQELLCKPCSILKRKKPKTKSKCQQGGFCKSYSFDDVATGILVLMILLLLLLGLCLVRSYNRARAYGTGGCLWPVLWGQCQIIT